MPNYNTHPSLENLIESENIGIESLHPGGLETTKELEDLCKVTESSRLLDVASGTGEGTCFLVEEFKCHTVGIDKSQVMITRAKEKAQEKNLNIDFKIGDASSEDIERKKNLQKFKKLQSIQNQSLIAMIIFVAGFGFMYWGGTRPGDLQHNLAIVASIAGFVWYLVNRVRIVLIKRFRS